MSKNSIINVFFTWRNGFLTKWGFLRNGYTMYVKLAIAFFIIINYERTNKENDTFFSYFLNEVEFFNDMELFTKWSHKTFIYIKCVFMLVIFSLIIRDSQGK